MLVFKFGGASVKDADGIKNLTEIVKSYQGEKLLVVVSAMGKTTNALEKLTRAYVDMADDVHEMYDEIKAYHFNILEQLFTPGNAIFDDIQNTFVEIDWMIEDEPHDDYDFIYDQIVSIGELVSTRIVSAYLKHAGVAAKWLDVRGYIHTDNNYREGTVDWDKTRTSILRDLPGMLNEQVVVTQGFLGGTSENFTTTLGREGSDYTASIFAACLGASSVTTWKDVAGILNADPKLFDDTIKFDELSYNEALEMTYYGATVIHPKTIKPLQNAGIPLWVKCFTNPQADGTIIKEGIKPTFAKPVIIVKSNQVMLSVFTRNYAFITEDHLSDIFAMLAKARIKTSLIQTSALSFTFCIDHQEDKFNILMQNLKDSFRVLYNGGLTLLTVRHPKQGDLEALIAGKQILLEQQSRNTVQFVIK